MSLIATANRIYKEDKELFKSIQKVPTIDVLGKNFNPPAGGEFAIVDEFNNILNFCTESYQLVPNANILLPVERKLKEANVEFSRQVNVYDNAQYHVSYFIKNHKKKVLGELYPKLTIVNSYDGKVKFRKEFGWMRLVCLNGLTRPHGVSDIKISKHSADMDEFALAMIVREISEQTTVFIKESKKDIERFEKLNAKEVNQKLIAQVTKELKLSDKIASAAEARFALETGSTKEPFTYVDLDGNLRTSAPADKSLFTLYNAINYAIYNLNPKEDQQKKSEKDARLLEYVETLN